MTTQVSKRTLLGEVASDARYLQVYVSATNDLGLGRLASDRRVKLHLNPKSRNRHLHRLLI